MRGLAGLLVLSWATVALATPLRIKNGATVHVALKGKRETGIGIRPKRNVWRIELGGSKETADISVELVDLTDGAANARLQLAPVDGVVTLDERFTAGHAYRVTLSRNRVELTSALVYLFPPTLTGKSKVQFGDEEQGNGPADDVDIVKKPSL